MRSTLLDRDLRAQVRQWFRLRHAHPLKSRGQHFMVSRRHLAAIGETAANLVHPTPALAVEFGPGLGFLTADLLSLFPRVIAVEIDRRFTRYLATTFSDQPQLTVVEHDFLTFPLSEISEPFILTGNLPYHLSTPVLELLSDAPPWLVGATVVVQREFAERAAASPGSRVFGRLSLFVQNRFHVRLGLLIPPSAFYPAPKVYSRVLSLLPRASPLIPEHLSREFHALVRAAFGSRRKMIRSGLSRIIAPEVARSLLARAEITDSVRPESLTFSDWHRLCEAAYSEGVLH